MDERINVLFPYFTIFSEGSYPWMTRKLRTSYFNWMWLLHVSETTLNWCQGNKLLTSKDVHNLRQVASSSGTTEDELLKVLENCIWNDPACTVSLIFHEDDELELLYIQTSRMKETAQNFPEVLLMDSTYRCNNRKMPLSTMMAMDGNSAGQVVAYALLRNERQETLRLFLSKFKALNSATT